MNALIMSSKNTITLPICRKSLKLKTCFVSPFQDDENEDVLLAAREGHRSQPCVVVFLLVYFFEDFHHAKNESSALKTKKFCC